MIAYRHRRKLKPIDYVIDFVPHLGYTWMVVENGVVLWDDVAATEYSAKEACRKKFEDFGLEFPDD